MMRRLASFLIILLPAGCAQPAALSTGDLATPTQFTVDLAGQDFSGVDLSGVDLAVDPGNCSPGSHPCGGGCILDGTCCTGADCPAYTNSTAMCMQGACVYTCNTGFKNCNGTCRSAMLCCMDADCMSKPNTSSTKCNPAGMCVVGTCEAGFYDFNGLDEDGCECKDEGKAKACTSASNLGSLAVGSSAVTSGNLPEANSSNWFTVTFAGSTNANYHPRIQLTGNPMDQFALEVLPDCVKAAPSCGNEAGTKATGITDFEHVRTGGDPGSTTYSTAIPGTGGNVKIRVYRKNPLAMGSCEAYLLTVSN